MSAHWKALPKEEKEEWNTKARSSLDHNKPDLKEKELQQIVKKAIAKLKDASFVAGSPVWYYTQLLLYSYTPSEDIR